MSLVKYSSWSNWRKRATFMVLCMTPTVIVEAQTFSTLYSFGGPNGAGPSGPLVQGTDGNLYGTTAYLGLGGGTVYKMTPDGILTLLYSFCSQGTCADGQTPYSGLIQAENGNFYGTTGEGGNYGSGTIFEMTAAGELMTLYSFCSEPSCTDGIGPYGGLLQVANGDMYGTTSWGGGYGLGTIFKITPSGALTTLYNFCSQIGCPDGEHPSAGLVRGEDGNFYGTTHGNVGDNSGSGTVFRITPTGTLTTLHTFCSQPGCPDGQFPEAGLVLAANGKLYGTTSQGGAGSNGGTIFELNPTGEFIMLYSFCVKVGCPDGSYPESALVQGTDGNLYGTTETGGSQNAYGTIFRITATGKLTTLHSFCTVGSCSDGFSPEAALVQDTNGKFYGTAESDGVNLGGTAFSLSMGLIPFVEAKPDYGGEEDLVNILGTHLTGTTGISFNGTPAVFEVVSSSLIVAKVPSGATSGVITVITPGRALSSKSPFRVLP